MIEDITSNRVLLLSVACIIVIAYFSYMAWLRSNYPPGPWPLPVIGNLHLLSERLYMDLASLAKRYGPVYTVWMGQRPTVIVCDLHSGKEAVVKKGIEFAGRAMDTKAMDMIFHQHEDMASRSFDQKVSIMRKIALSVVNSQRTMGLPIQSIVKEETDHFLKSLQSVNGIPFNPEGKLTLFSSNVVMKLLYNIRFEDENDPAFHAFKKKGDDENDAFQKSVLTNIFPILWYLRPDVRKAVQRATLGSLAFCDEHYGYHEETYTEGKIRDLTDLIIKKKMELQSSACVSSTTLSRLNALLLLFNVEGAGTETVRTLISWVILAVLHYPDIQQRIHEEIDSLRKGMASNSNSNAKEMNLSEQLDTENVADNDCSSIIDVSQQQNLPFLNAVIHEVMRLCPPLPLALPHKTMVDTSLGTFRIPKDTPVMLNIYAIHTNSSVWDEPHVFKPERFLDESGNFDSEKGKQLMIFGQGPRSCTGEKLARVELFTCIASMFSHFKLSTPDANLLPSLNDGLFGLTLKPKPMEVIFNSKEKEYN